VRILQCYVCLSNSASPVDCICTKVSTESGVQMIIYPFKLFLSAIEIVVRFFREEFDWEGSVLFGWDYRSVAGLKILDLSFEIEHRITCDVVQVLDVSFHVREIRGDFAFKRLPRLGSIRFCIYFVSVSLVQNSKLEVDQKRSPTCLIVTKILDRITKYEQKTLCECSSATHLSPWMDRST
jgi:hypothetical protein